MEAVASISARIWEIRSHMAQLGPPVAPPAATPGVPAARAVAPLPTSAAMFASAMNTATNERVALVAPLPSARAMPDAVGSGLTRVDAGGVPLELVGFGNGRVPAEALSTVAGTDHTLWAPAARSLEALRDAAARDGVSIGITDSYRSYTSQIDVAERKGLYSQGGLAAVPGTSDHGWGIATDLRLDPAAQDWMRTNGARYGFVEDVPREPWHWSYRPTF